MASVVSEKKGRCVCCSYESYKESEFLEHLKSHICEKNFKVPCIFCGQTLKDFKTYKKHKKSCVELKAKNHSQMDICDKDLHFDLLWACENCPQKIGI